MKNKLNIILALGLLCLGATGYATCYLNQVVSCFITGDLVQASYVHTGAGESSYYADVYADEPAWRYDRYSVTRGGKSAQTANNYVSPCTGGTYSGEGPLTARNDVHGFQVHFYNPFLPG